MSKTEKYDVTGPRFRLSTPEDIAIADAAFAEVTQRKPGWTFADLYEEVVADPQHPLRSYLTQEDRVLRKAWMADLRMIASEIRVYRYRNGDKVQVSVRKYLTVDVETEEDHLSVVLAYDVVRKDQTSLDAVGRRYASRIMALVHEFDGFADHLTGFAKLVALASEVRGYQSMPASADMAKVPAGTSRTMQDKGLRRSRYHGASVPVATA